MAESSSQNPSSPRITPKEEPVTLDKPESPNPFLPADQVEFTFDEITFTTNNEVTLIYPDHQKSEFISSLTSSQICLGGKTGGLDQISNKDATIFYCLANGVKVDYAKLIWEEIIHNLNKKTREKVVTYPSVQNWALKPNQTEGPSFTDHMKAICNLDVPVDSKPLKPSSQTEEVPQGKKPGAKNGLKRKQSLKHTFKSKTEASKYKTGQSVKDTQSSSDKDKSPGHPSPPTSVVGEMHKEAQQAAGGPTSLGATSEEGAHPQLSSGHDASVDSTAEADAGNPAPNDSIPPQQVQIRNKPITVSDESEEEVEADNDTDTHATSHDVPEETSILYPPSPKSAQIQALMAQKLKALVLRYGIRANLGDLKRDFNKTGDFPSISPSLHPRLRELKKIQWELSCRELNDLGLFLQKAMQLFHLLTVEKNQ
ncbi:hypothetical protein Tco_0210028 [Tanacetum coccineum]